MRIELGRTVCSSIHFLPLFIPSPSTNLRCKIWKCTGGPPNAVKPRSHVRAKTSVRRGPIFSCVALRRDHNDLAMDWRGIVVQRACKKLQNFSYREIVTALHIFEAIVARHGPIE